MYTGKIAVAYLGNNNPYKFKRGVENVIESQAACFDYGTKYYIFFDNKQSVFRWKDIICIGIKNNAWKYLVLNLIIGKLKKKTKFSNSFTWPGKNYFAPLQDGLADCPRCHLLPKERKWTKI